MGDLSYPICHGGDLGLQVPYTVQTPLKSFPTLLLSDEGILDECTNGVAPDLLAPCRPACELADDHVFVPGDLLREAGGLDFAVLNLLFEVTDGLLA